MRTVRANAAPVLPRMLLLALALASAVAARAEGALVLVANPSLAIASIDRGTLRRIYLGDQRELAGQRVMPALLFDDSHLLAHFSVRILGMTPARARAYWAQLDFSGRGETPRQFASREALLDYVSGTPAALAFVAEGWELPASVRVLALTWESMAESEP